MAAARPLRWTLRVLAGLLALGLLVVGITATRVWWVARQDERPRSDAIVVLGASQFDGRPSPVLRARLLHAKALYEAGVAPRVVTVGGQKPGDRTTEAEAGAAYLRQRGVPVVAVPEGRNTRQSVEAVDELFAERGWERAVIVTDPWHALRTRRIAADAGLSVASSPARSGPAVRTRGVQLRYILRETAAYLHYRLGGSAESGPDAF